MGSEIRLSLSKNSVSRGDSDLILIAALIVYCVAFRLFSHSFLPSHHLQPFFLSLSLLACCSRQRFSFLFFFPPLSFCLFCESSSSFPLFLLIDKLFDFYLSVFKHNFLYLLSSWFRSPLINLHSGLVR